MPVTLESWDCRLGLQDLALTMLIFNCYHRFRKEISVLRSNSAQFANKKHKVGQLAVSSLQGCSIEQGALYNTETSPAGSTRRAFVNKRRTDEKIE